MKNATANPTDPKSPKRVRGRPRTREPSAGRQLIRKPGAAAPREEILKVAASVFALKGYAGTTMAEIADLVGIRSPSLYYHFKDKAEILRGIADIILDEAIADSHKLLKIKGAPASTRLGELVRGLVFRLRTSPYELNCMFDPAFHSEEFRVANRKLHAWLGDLESIIQQGIEEGLFSPQNPKVATYTVRGLVESAIRQMGGYPKMSAKDMADYVANFAVNGLSVAASRV